MAEAVSAIDTSKATQGSGERPAEVCQSDSGGAILRNTKQLTTLPLAQQANNEQSNDELMVSNAILGGGKGRYENDTEVYVIDLCVCENRDLK